MGRRIIASLFLTFVSSISTAASLGSLANSNLEAASPCASGHCLASLMVPGANEVASQSSELLHSINIFKRDSRVEQSRKGKSNPYSAIGRIQTTRDLDVLDAEGKVVGKGKGRGTAFLVSPCYALTNYHVVFGTLSQKDVIPHVKSLYQRMQASDSPQVEIPSDRNFTMSLFLGETSNGSFAKEFKGYPVAFGEEKNGRLGSDWTLVRFDRPNCPGDDPEIGWLETAEVPHEQLMSIDILTAGYPADKSGSALFRSSACRAYESTSKGLGYLHDCPTMPGQSGSPMLAMIDGKPKVVGIHVGPPIEYKNVLEKYEPIKANLAASVEAFSDSISKRVQKDLQEYFARHPEASNSQGTLSL